MVGAVGNLCYAFLAVLSFTLDTAFLRFRLAPTGGGTPCPLGSPSEICGLTFCVLCVVPEGGQPKEKGAQRANGTTEHKQKGRFTK